MPVSHMTPPHVGETGRPVGKMSTAKTARKMQMGKVRLDPAQATAAPASVAAKAASVTSAFATFWRPTTRPVIASASAIRLPGSWRPSSRPTAAGPTTTIHSMATIQVDR